MPFLQLESATHGTLSLDGIASVGKGVQARSGVTGLGLPPVDVQWRDAAGDGATFHGKRVLPRDIDIPLWVEGMDRSELKALVRQLSLMLAGEVTVRFVEDDGTSWSVKAHRTGGFDYVYGGDTTGERELLTVVTLRAGSPFWESSEEYVATIKSSEGDGLLKGGSLVNLGLTDSLALGSIVMQNPGDVATPPVWFIQGPATKFTAISPTGEKLEWSGTLTSEQSLTIDCAKGTVTRNTGANAYSGLAAAPKFWSVAPGESVASVSLEGANSNSYIRFSYRPLRWQVI